MRNNAIRKRPLFLRALRGKRLDWYCSAIVGKANLYYETAAHNQSFKSPAFTEKASETGEDEEQIVRSA